MTTSNQLNTYMTQIQRLTDGLKNQYPQCGVIQSEFLNITRGFHEGKPMTGVEPSLKKIASNFEALGQSKTGALDAAVTTNVKGLLTNVRDYCNALSTSVEAKSIKADIMPITNVVTKQLQGLEVQMSSKAGKASR